MHAARVQVAPDGSRTPIVDAGDEERPALVPMGPPLPTAMQRRCNCTLSARLRQTRLRPVSLRLRVIAKNAARMAGANGAPISPTIQPSPRKYSAAVTRTFSIIKPDATRRNLTGAVTKMLEGRLRVVASKRIHMSKEQAEGFYAVHKERPFFGELVDFMISEPVVVQCWKAKTP